MKTLNPYLALNGKCREAMTFYQKTFGGELSFLTVGESPICDQMPAEAKDTIMHSSLTFEAGTIMATDMTGPDNCSGQAAIPFRSSIALDCSSDEEAQRVFNAVAEGGATMCPLGPAFWGGIFGAVTDRFGVNWMITFNDQAAQ